MDTFVTLLTFRQFPTSLWRHFGSHSYSYIVSAMVKSGVDRHDMRHVRFIPPRKVSVTTLQSFLNSFGPICIMDTLLRHINRNPQNTLTILKTPFQNTLPPKHLFKTPFQNTCESVLRFNTSVLDRCFETGFWNTLFGFSKHYLKTLSQNTYPEDYFKTPFQTCTGGTI